MRRLVVVAFLSAICCQAATKLLVTVVEQRSGKPVTGLKAGDFSVLDDNRPRQVESAEPFSGPMDVMLLVDSSQAGAFVRRPGRRLACLLVASRRTHRLILTVGGVRS